MVFFNNELEGYEMKTLKNFKLLGIAILLAAGLAACDKQPGPAESAGKMIDQTAVDAGRRSAKPPTRWAKRSMQLPRRSVTR